METYAKLRLLIVAGDALFVRVFLAQQIRLLVSDGFEVRLTCSPGADTAELSALPCAVEYIPMARTMAPLTALPAGVKTRLRPIDGLRSDGLAASYLHIRCASYAAA